MDEISPERADRLRLLQLLGEVRKLGSEINEPIEIEYLNLSMNTHAPKHKVLIPLSEI